jgi:hypothetical protein
MADADATGQPICPRCGEELYPETDGDELTLVFTARTPEGGVHWDCATLAEQRREDFQCEFCGAQYYNDGSDSDKGWIVELDQLLCPDCITPEEDHEDAPKFIDLTTLGQLISELDRRQFPH